MSKSKERNKAIALRRKGKSIKEIAKRIGVSKGSASIWCRDIVLSSAQIRKLHKSMVSGGYAGRMKGARMQYERRLKTVKEAQENGKLVMGRLSERDLLISFVSLYCGEGSNKSRQFAINHSAPAMIQFIIKALRKLWGIKKERFILTIGINQIHQKREKKVKDYCSNL